MATNHNPKTIIIREQELKPYLDWSRPKTEVANRYFDLDQLDFQDSIRLKAKAWVFSIRNASYRQAKKADEIKDDQQLEPIVDISPSHVGDNTVNPDINHQINVTSQKTTAARIKEDIPSTDTDMVSEPISIMANLDTNKEDLDLFWQDEFRDDFSDIKNDSNGIDNIWEEIVNSDSNTLSDKLGDDQAGLALWSADLLEPTSAPRPIPELAKEDVSLGSTQTEDTNFDIQVEVVELVDDLDNKTIVLDDISGSAEDNLDDLNISSIWDAAPFISDDTNEAESGSVANKPDSYLISVKSEKTSHKANIDPRAIQDSMVFFNSKELGGVASSKEDKVTFTENISLNLDNKDDISTITKHNKRTILDDDNDSKWWWDKTGSVDYLADINYKDISSSIKSTDKKVDRESVTSFDISGLARKESKFRFFSVIKKLMIFVFIIIGTWLIFFRSGYQGQINTLKNIIPIWRAQVDVITSSGIVVNKIKPQDRIIARVKYKKKYSGIITVSYLNRNTDKYLIKNLNMRIDNADITPIYLPIAQDNGTYVLSVTIADQKIDKQIIIE